MRIRLTRYSGAPLVAVSAGDDDGPLPHTVRFVGPAVADAVEELLAALPFGGATGLNPQMDLDAVLDQAAAAVRERTGRHGDGTPRDVTPM